MAVVPFSRIHGQVTVVPDADFQLSGTAVSISPLEDKLLAEANASYDLHVGSLYKDHRDERTTQLEEGKYIVIRPGRAVIIETGEHIELPLSRFGYIVPKVNLLQQGISNTVSKVDPGYKGRLSITLFNLGRRTIKVGFDDPFCSLVIHDVAPLASRYSKGPKGMLGALPKLTWWELLRDFADTNSGVLSLVSPLLATLIAIVPLLIHRWTVGTWLSH